MRVRCPSSWARAITWAVVALGFAAVVGGTWRIVTDILEVGMDLTAIIVTAIVPVVAALVVALAMWTKPAVNEDAPMARGPRLVLGAYLAILGFVLAYLITKLSALDFPDTPLVPEHRPLPAPITMATTPAAPSAPPARSPAGQPTPGALQYPPDASVPVLLHVFPESTIGTTPTLSLTVYGRNFTKGSGATKGSEIRFNTEPRPTTFINTDLMSAELRAADLAAVGAVTVDVMNPGNKVSSTIMVRVTKPVVPLKIFTRTVPITREAQLILLAIFAGSLGSFMHALKSLADFIGNRTLTGSWFWWYVARPFLGMAMALTFYALLRGGFLAGTPGDAKVVNPFGVIAIGALVGMFADKAAQKLGEIFDTLFKSQDSRSGKLTAPALDKIDPPIIFSDEGPKPVKLIGDKLGKVSKVRLNAIERQPDTVSEKEVVITLQTEDLKPPREVKITAVNPDGETSPAATLRVSDLAITPAALPDARISTAYSQPLAATG